MKCQALVCIKKSLLQTNKQIKKIGDYRNNGRKGFDNSITYRKDLTIQLHIYKTSVM